MEKEDEIIMQINEDITVVTACVGDKYLSSLERGLGDWHKSKFIKHCNMLIYTDEKHVSDVKLAVLKASDRYKGELTVKLLPKYPDVPAFKEKGLRS
jgi:hypothetical protein